VPSGRPEGLASTEAAKSPAPAATVGGVALMHRAKVWQVALPRTNCYPPQLVGELKHLPFAYPAKFSVNMSCIARAPELLVC
jgi:hypothetical protein